ncbi:hypothetical protein FSP39_006403 [Pinctada imbricata]|uniref:Centrosomal protein CEP104 Zn finger domain-containing protein n=1 Tax=Pinctada imbricata TaxID=66713 RepID=A0AA88YAJ1_PINIB|nr:hypothetical protein FSP39_006403 [Pinctada imbricata]
MVGDLSSLKGFGQGQSSSPVVTVGQSASIKDALNKAGIASFTEHLLTECLAKEQFERCPSCKKAVQKTLFNEHIWFCQRAVDHKSSHFDKKSNEKSEADELDGKSKISLYCEARMDEEREEPITRQPSHGPDMHVSGTQPSSVILSLNNVIWPKTMKIIMSKNVPNDVAEWVGYDATGPTSKSNHQVTAQSKTPKHQMQKHKADKHRKRRIRDKKHRNIKHKGLHINQRDQLATSADLGRPSATERAEGAVILDYVRTTLPLFRLPRGLEERTIVV